jgi:asparagine synthase (glutamine-hydrolysing)
MCGFIIVYNKSKKTRKKEISNCIKDLSHRGPDYKKILIHKNFLVGFTRLSINNIVNGNQPLFKRKNDIIVCFNGEFLNFKELSSEYLNEKENVKNEVEAIFHLYLSCGLKFIKKIKGFFSIVIIDFNKNEIFFMVDRFGIKPLYYGNLNNNNFFITSDYSPMLKSKMINQSLNYKNIYRYLSYGIINKDTIFKNIKSLNQASIVNYKIKTGKFFLKKYWRPKFKSKEKSFEKFEEIISNQIKQWSKSEVDLALSLSDGVDSQIIKYFLDKYKIKHKTYTLRPNYKTFKYFKQKETNVTNFNSNKFSSYMKKYFNRTLIPLNNPSDLSFFFIYDKINKNKNIKVNIIGEGADEIFGGYDRYKLFCQNKNIYKNKIQKNSTYVSKFYKPYKHDYDYNFSNLNTKNDLLKFDQEKWLPNVVPRHDLIGMLFSIEARPFFLDNDIVDFANNLSSNNKFDKNKNKIFLKQFCKNLDIKFHREKKGTPNFFEELQKNQVVSRDIEKSISSLKKYDFFDMDIYLRNFYNKNIILDWRMYNISMILSKI